MIKVKQICEYMGVPYVIGSGLDPVELLEKPVSIDDDSSRARNSFSFCDHPGVSGLTRRPVELLDDIEYPYRASKEEESKVIQRIQKSNAAVVICPYLIYPAMNKVLIKVANPRLAFMNVMDTLKRPVPIIHKTAVINDCVKMGKNVSVGPNTVIGYDGFGMWRGKSGQLRKFPQLGGVIIEENVEIKANVCIDRGALGNTVIGAGSKIDNLVHIAHNVKVGRNVAIVAHTIVGGSAVIGDNVWIAPNASILNGITIGENSLVGMGAVVVKDVPANTVVKGNPAK